MSERILINKRLTQVITRTTILSLLFIGVVRLQPIWMRYPGGLWNLLFHLLIVLFFILICYRFFAELYRIVKSKSPATFYTVIPLLILSVTLLDIIYNPLQIDLEKTYGEVLFRACYEGTQNQATFKLREGNTFELHATGAFFYDELFSGSYRQKGDTLFLNFGGKQPSHFSDTLLMDNHKRILTINRKVNDSIPLSLPFYYGYCKGTN